MKTIDIKPEARDEIITNSRVLLERDFLKAFNITDPYNEDWNGKFGWYYTGDYHFNERFINEDKKMYCGNVYNTGDLLIATLTLGAGTYSFDEDYFVPTLYKILQFNIGVLDFSIFNNLTNDKERQEHVVTAFDHYSLDRDLDELIEKDPDYVKSVPKNFMKIQWCKSPKIGWDFVDNDDGNGVRIFNVSPDNELKNQRLLLNTLINQKNSIFDFSYRKIPDFGIKLITESIGEGESNSYSFDYTDDKIGVDIYKPL